MKVAHATLPIWGGILVMGLLTGCVAKTAKTAGAKHKSLCRQ